MKESNARSTSCSNCECCPVCGGARIEALEERIQELLERFAEAEAYRIRHELGVLELEVAERIARWLDDRSLELDGLTEQQAETVAIAEELRAGSWRKEGT